MICKECFLSLEKHTLFQLESCASLTRVKRMIYNYSSEQLNARREELIAELNDTTKQE
jgi:hypothetical protein